MPQLFFEPSATKIGEDDWLVTPKNNSDSIDVSETEGTEDIKTGNYKFVARCNTLAKDIILAMWGIPTQANGVCKGRTHSADIIESMCEQYENIWLPDSNTGKYIVESTDSNIEYDTLEEAMASQVKQVKDALRLAQTAGGGTEDDNE